MEKLNQDLQKMAELILQEKNIRTGDGLSFTAYKVIKNDYDNNVGKTMHSIRINQMLSKYPSDLEYIVTNKDEDILFKNFENIPINEEFKNEEIKEIKEIINKTDENLELTEIDLYLSTNPIKLLKDEESRIKSMPYGKEKEEAVIGFNKLAQGYHGMLIEQIKNA